MPWEETCAAGKREAWRSGRLLMVTEKGWDHFPDHTGLSSAAHTPDQFIRSLPIILDTPANGGHAGPAPGMRPYRFRPP
jgi:hypothetical protein